MLGLETKKSLFYPTHFTVLPQKEVADYVYAVDSGLVGDALKRNKWKAHPMALYGFGVNQDGESTMVRYNGIRVWEEVIVKEVDADEVKKVLEKFLANYKVVVEKVKKKSMFYWNSPYVCVLRIYLCGFSNYNGVKGLINRLPQDVLCKIRYVKPSRRDLQVQTYANVVPCKWYNITGSHFDTNGSDQVKTKKFVQVDYWEESEVTGVPNIKVVCYDIETYSASKGRFPKAGNPGDVIFMISAMLCETGNESPLRSVVLTTKDYCEDTRRGEDGIQAEKIVLATEADLIVEFCKFIADSDALMVTGFNVSGFDADYIHQRIKLLRLEVPNMSLIKGNIPYCFINKSWGSTQVKRVEQKYMFMQGRISHDVMISVKMCKALSSYTLKYTSVALLGEKYSKMDLPIADMFRLYETGNYTEFAEVAKYCLQDTHTTWRLFCHLMIWVNESQQCQVYGINPNDLRSHGQQHKISSLLFRYLWKSDYLIDNYHYDTDTEVEYKGAYVFDPVPGYYEDVVTFDFASLYPSIIISNNIDYSTMVEEGRDLSNYPAQDFLDVDHGDGKVIKFYQKEPGVIPSIIKSLLTARKNTRELLRKNTWTKTQRESLEMLQNAYKIVANSMYGAMGSSCGILGMQECAASVTIIGRQSLEKVNQKVTNDFGAKVIYGDTDSVMVKFPRANPQEDNLKVVTPDSDKYIDFLYGNNQTLEDFSELVATETSKLFNDPMKLEFECIAKQFFIVGKKMYTAILSNGKKKEKGLALVRRDVFTLTKDVMNKLVKGIFTYVTPESIHDILIEHVNNVMSRSYSSISYVKSTTLKSKEEYKKKQYTDLELSKTLEKKGLETREQLDDTLSHSNALLMTKLLSRNKPVLSGDRVEYVITRTVRDLTSLVVKGKMEDYEYYQQNSSYIKLNTYYYAISSLKSLDNIIETRWPEHTKLLLDLKKTIKLKTLLVSHIPWVTNKYIF